MDLEFGEGGSRDIYFGIYILVACSSVLATRHIT